ncbi:hypothetical protein GH714_042065 [Hevea brasiliensis]|uniref:Uncharacterized protein n=1 Tax=Hevea brasiliensis TaxID=3981 RepID=A0A6A6MU74_HEVBR|nr:hypothetical protein GH714_042065 [Hevea brasiliensis]
MQVAKKSSGIRMASSVAINSEPPTSKGVNHFDNPYEVVRHLASSNAVVLFSMSGCCMCTVAKRLLFGLGVGPPSWSWTTTSLVLTSRQSSSSLHRTGSSQSPPSLWVASFWVALRCSWLVISTAHWCLFSRMLKYSGMVVDCCCDYETVDRLNEEVLHPSLQDLEKTPFFRYFKWIIHVQVINENHNSLVALVFGWNSDEMSLSGVFSLAAEMTYVNLQLKPDQYTGYSGPSARRIWDAIYSENCPKYPSEELCREERILYKLISGLHFSISIHIADRYLLDKSNNLWGCNPTLMYDRVLRYTGRVRNLYFTYLFVLRAVMKNCALMDCVGCEKCRLWGKLQVLGLGTALKILFSDNGWDYWGQTQIVM